MAIATGTALLAGGLLAGAGSAYAGSQASKASEREGAEGALASRQAIQRSSQQYAQTRADLAPYRQVGTEALDMYRNMVLGGDMSQFQTSPSYQFRLGEGIKSRENIAAARGGLLSGSQLKGIEQYSQGMASDEYQNYLNQVYNLSQQGLGAATQTGQLGSQSIQEQNKRGFQGAEAYGQGIMGSAQGRSEMYGGALGAMSQGLGAYAGYTGQRELYSQYGQGIKLSPQPILL